MAPEVTVWQQHSGHRSRLITRALVLGAKAAGFRVQERPAVEYRGRPESPIAAMYGYHDKLVEVFHDHVAKGHPLVYVDMGYFGRKTGGNWAGYHKVSVNNRHPTAYFRQRPHDPGRFRLHGIPIRPWREDRAGAVMVAGMGPKAARAAGLGVEEWERAAIAEIRRHTDRPIIYRPKPSFVAARPMPGAEFSDNRVESIERALERCWCVVTHHSNAAIDAILAGVPAFAFEGVAKPVTSQDLKAIEAPLRPDDRAEWAADIAWCQFNVDEITRGVAWRHLREEGLLER